MLPEGHRLHVVLEGISRGFSAVNIRKFVLTRRPAARPGRARQPDRRRPRRSSRRRCAPGSTSWSPAAPRPARPRCSTAWPRRSPAATGWSRAEEVFELRFPHPDWVRDADPAGRARGHRRDPAARPGQGEPADAADAGSSSARSAPRSASTCCSRSTPGCRACAPLHANSAREALVKMCTLPLLAGENISARFVVPDRRVARSTSSSTSASTPHGVRRVNEIVGGARAGSRTTSSRPSRSSCAASGELRRGQRDAAAAGALRAGRHRRPRGS